MNSSLKPALESLDNALGNLEKAIQERLREGRQGELNLFTPQEPANQVNEKVALKLDSTIKRLEMLLEEE